MNVLLKKLLYVSMAVVLTALLVTRFERVAATEEIDGSLDSYGYNNPTIVSGVRILDSNGVELSGVDKLTRLADFILEFKVYDIDGFSNLDVYFALYNTGARSTDSGLLDTVINSGTTDEALVLRWIAPERSEFTSGFTNSAFTVTSGQNNFYVKSGATALTPGTSNSGVADFVSPSSFNAIPDSQSTWEVTTTDLPNASGLVTMSGIVNTFSGTTIIDSGVRNIQYTVQVPITMSKVASSIGTWNFGLVVRDLLQVEIEEPKTDIEEVTYAWASQSYDNQWYGEVSLVSSGVLTFTDVIAGSGGFQTSDESIELNFISNGSYSQNVQADTTWNPAVTIPNRVEFAYLVPSSGLTSDDELLATEGNRFALQARRISLDGDDVVQSGVDVTIPLLDSLDPVPATNAQIGNNDIYRQNLDPDNAKLSEIIQISTASATSEPGINSEFNFGLKLSAVFQNTVYSGNISVGISNDPDDFFGQ